MESRDARYSTFSTHYMFCVHARQRSMLGLLKDEGVEWLGDKRILEVGCGSGGILAELLFLGARPYRLVGIDVSAEHIDRCMEKLSGVRLCVADAAHLPYDDNSFDLVFQFTVFSSIGEETQRELVAREMMRVLAPGGLVVWYDFWVNPVNRRTIGMRRKDIERLFPGSSVTARRVTLAPPLARFLVPRTRLLAELLEASRLLNSHFLAVIRPPSAASARETAGQRQGAPAARAPGPPMTAGSPR